MSLFEPDLPDGFRYLPDVISADSERQLGDAIASVSFDTFEMRGVVARRRVKFFGASYNDRVASPWPDFLLPVRALAATWAEIDPEAFVMGLVNEYTPGATIGWHRDAPQYGTIVGLSLLSACRMKLRPYRSPSTRVETGRTLPRKTTHQVQLEPRSGYVIAGLARSDYEHSIPPSQSLRYSVTFRTMR